MGNLNAFSFVMIVILVGAVILGAAIVGPLSPIAQAETGSIETNTDYIRQLDQIKLQYAPPLIQAKTSTQIQQLEEDSRFQEALHELLFGALVIALVLGFLGIILWVALRTWRTLGEGSGNSQGAPTAIAHPELCILVKMVENLNQQVSTLQMNNVGYSHRIGALQNQLQEMKADSKELEESISDLKQKLACLETGSVTTNEPSSKRQCDCESLSNRLDGIAEIMLKHVYAETSTRPNGNNHNHH